MQNITLPHDHGQLIEKQPERIPKEEEFQTVSDILSSSATAAACAFSGCSAIMRSA